MDTKIGLPSRLAFSKTSGDQAYQSTGLCACSNRYGLVSRARRFVCRAACGAGLVAAGLVAVGAVGGSASAGARLGKPVVLRIAHKINSRRAFHPRNERR